MNKHQSLNNIQYKSLTLEEVDMDKIYCEIKLELEKRKSCLVFHIPMWLQHLKSYNYLLSRKINSFMTSELLPTQVIATQENIKLDCNPAFTLSCLKHTAKFWNNAVSQTMV